ncbi:MAG: 5-(carboxyamino)imidazole ribonucleotide mutase [Actinobacteria bacterium]|nr:5-(carboxyamino)imidazole ribonucleotide mutase [Actinomycetota bacterium]
MPNEPVVGILMGSPNDRPTVDKCMQVLDELGIPCEVRVLSAHRTPDAVHEYASAAAGRGIQVLIGCAGMAAHLAGVLAAVSQLPVIGVPLSGGVADGLDALLATVQMPKGVPVATVGVDATQNAAWLAARILALSDEDLAKRLAAARDAERERMAQADADIRAQTGP